MSRIEAPSPASRIPCSIARSGEKYAPPSENESGVTLTIPMTRGRGRFASSDGQSTEGGCLTPSLRATPLQHPERGLVLTVARGVSRGNRGRSLARREPAAVERVEREPRGRR